MRKRRKRNNPQLGVFPIIPIITGLTSILGIGTTAYAASVAAAEQKKQAALAMAAQRQDIQASVTAQGEALRQQLLAAKAASEKKYRTYTWLAVGGAALAGIGAMYILVKRRKRRA
jgi:LPXTG-motif cell wall-anchored protein